jgi:hypothetical protein
MPATRLLVFILILLGFLIVPRVALAQSAIAGTVKDATGAVLPGVTVEASSPALIEKAKSATTNESGQYRVVDLRPGTYSVTFSVSGFNTIVREGIVLEADFTAPLNVEMRVGNVSETVTVTGASPVVDVQTSQRREVVSKELLDALPTGRQFMLMANSIPAVTTGGFDVGGSSTMWHGGGMSANGSSSSDSRTLVDGMVVDAMFPTGQCSCVYDNEMQTQEIAVNLNGGSAENQLSGVLVNRIPRTGGNTFSGDELVTFSGSKLQSRNLDDALRARGVGSPDELYRQYDFNYSLGGPIVRDRLWFFATGRHWAYNNYVLGGIKPDGSRYYNDNFARGFPVRITGQVSKRDRVTGLMNYSTKGQNSSAPGGWQGPAVTAPEATVVQRLPYEIIGQLKWTSTLGSRVLFETGFSRTYHKNDYSYQPEIVRSTCFTAFDLCAPGTGYGSLSNRDTVLVYDWGAPFSSTTSGQGPQSNPGPSNVVQASLAYVSGAHSFKAGFQHRSGYRGSDREVNGDINQQFSNGRSLSVQALNTPITQRSQVNHDLGVFVQDTWTMKRLTVSPGVRWDYFNASIPAQSAPAGRFVPARSFAAVENIPNWQNVVPRIGAAYDVTGRGRTAVRGNFGLYVESAGTTLPERYNPMVFSTDTRTWDDRDGDKIAQERELGPTSNLTFGQLANRRMDPDLKRPFQTVWSAGVNHELARGFGVAVTFTERSYHRTNLLRNLAIPANEYTLLSVADPRGNGPALPVYSINRAVFGLVDQLDTNSDENTQVYRGLDVTFNGRLPGGGSFIGGTSTGRTISVSCEVNDLNSLRFCDESLYGVPLRTNFKLSGTYPLPFAGIRLSGVFQSVPGSERIITYQVSRTLLPALVQPSVNVRLNEPGTEYNDRINQLDFTISRSFRTRTVDVRPEIAIFNLLNVNAVTAQTNAFGPNLGRVTSVLNARLVRVGVSAKF